MTVDYHKFSGSTSNKSFVEYWIATTLQLLCILHSLSVSSQEFPTHKCRYTYFHLAAACNHVDIRSGNYQFHSHMTLLHRYADPHHIH